MHKKPQTWISLIVAILLIIAQRQGWLHGAGQTLQTNQPGLYRVTRFIDGDTIQVDMNGKNEKVRFIGVDTPETHKPNTPVQCYGPAAAAFTKSTIGNQSVRLESDSLSNNRDRYNRLLRYIYLPDGTLVNKKLIENGYGFYYPYFPFTKSVEFSYAQQTAKSANFLSFLQYVLVSPQTYAEHKIRERWHMYWVVITCIILYLPGRILHRGYSPYTQKFSLTWLLTARPETQRIDPTSNVA